MGLLDRLFGRRDRSRDGGPTYTRRPTGRLSDDQALERYRYLLRTAPPDQIEQAHAEAFAQLTPEQRRQGLGQLSAAGGAPPAHPPPHPARAGCRPRVGPPGPTPRAAGRGRPRGPSCAGPAPSSARSAATALVTALVT